MTSAKRLSLPVPDDSIRNFVFIGEAGCGKSELAINLSLSLVDCGERQVHLFDLDMTKPLFRSRDQASFLSDRGVTVHFEKQFYDAPTVSGGVQRLMRDPDCYTVLDVGGDYIGARAVGGYAPQLNAADTAVWYVVNPYRPWSMDLQHIDAVLSQVLGVSHVQLDRLRMMGNPNLGPDTRAEDVLAGADSVREMIGPYKDIDCYAVMEDLLPAVQNDHPGPWWPIRLYLTYEWV